MEKTLEQFSQAVGRCRDLFIKKTADYGTAWRILRPSSITDQLYIKALRIRSIEEKGFQKVADPVEGEFVGLVNYSVLALIQMTLPEDAPLELAAISSMTDLILQKLLRIKQIEDNSGLTQVSEGLEANYRDIINYAVFALIRLSESTHHA